MTAALIVVSILFVIMLIKARKQRLKIRKLQSEKAFFAYEAKKYYELYQTFSRKWLFAKMGK